MPALDRALGQLPKRHLLQVHILVFHNVDQGVGIPQLFDKGPKAWLQRALDTLALRLCAALLFLFSKRLIA